MSTKLIGSQIKSSTKIQGLIKEIISEVEKLNSEFTNVKVTQPDLKETANTQFQQTGAFRGRPLFYQYTGTGAGRGPFVELIDGSVKLDLINGIGIHLMGHANPRVMRAAVEGALSDIVMQGNLQPNEEYRILSEKLINLASKNSRLKHVWFATCGTMANETALKIARQKLSPAKMIIGFKNAFAGRSTMMAELTDNPAYKQGLPDYNEVLRIPFYDKNDPQSTEKSLQELKKHIANFPNQICCFVFEPMLGEGGYQAAPREFFIPLLEECKKNKIAIWADEVQTFTRTGELFAFETLNIGQYIDICTVAKTLQTGATFYTEEYNPKPGLVSGTFSGSTVSLKAGMEIVDMLQEGFLGPEGRIQKIHKKFIAGLNKLNETSCKGLVQDAGGMGLMIAFTPFEGKKEQVDVFLKNLYSNGIIAFNCGKDPIRARFLVPAIILDQEIDLALSIVEKTIQQGY